MVDHSQMKLGKLPPGNDPNIRKLKAYLPAAHLPVPDTIDEYTKIAQWPMMANDRLGDCTIASVGHCIQLWTNLAQTEAVVFPDATIIEAYSAITGYSPSKPNSDNGAVEQDVLKYWKTTGIGGHQIDNYISIDTKNEYELQLAAYLFGAVYTGVALPITAQNQDVWDVVEPFWDSDSQPGSWGGHAVPVVGYNSTGPVCITWGAPKQITWAWWRKYGEEAYAVLSKDWVDQSLNAPNHINWAQLEQDLAQDF